MSFKNTIFTFKQFQADQLFNASIYDIIYYPKINLLILPRVCSWSNVLLLNVLLLNISTDPYSNYTWCGDNGK